MACSSWLWRAGEEITSPITQAECGETRDALAKAIYSRMFDALVRSLNEALGGEAFREHFHADEIIRYNLGGTFDGISTPATVAPYGEEDAARFEIDYGILEQYLGFFAGCDILVADPGAEIDLLAMTGRFDLIREYLNFLRQRFDTVITSVHHAGITLPLLEGRV